MLFCVCIFVRLIYYHRCPGCLEVSDSLFICLHQRLKHHVDCEPEVEVNVKVEDFSMFWPFKWLISHTDSHAGEDKPESVILLLYRTTVTKYFTSLVSCFRVGLGWFRFREFREQIFAEILVPNTHACIYIYKEGSKTEGRTLLPGSQVFIQCKKLQIVGQPKKRFDFHDKMWGHPEHISVPQSWSGAATENDHMINSALTRSRTPRNSLAFHSLYNLSIKWLCC